MSDTAAIHRQSGAATLLSALVLMTSITIVTLAVARNQLLEQRMLNNDIWLTRLRLEAETGVAKATEHINTRLHTILWTQSANGRHESYTMHPSQGGTDIQRTLKLFRATDNRAYIKVIATATRDDGSQLDATVSQYVRPLSILTPFSEKAPPLILKGCLSGIPHDLHLHPANTDTALAADAAIIDTRAACTITAGVDFHNGTVNRLLLPNDLWPAVFSIDRQAFKQLALGQGQMPAAHRRYWRANPSDLISGRWSTSLGSPQVPVALHFPPETGCPQFAAGIQIYGVVFIDSPCLKPLATHSFQLFGTLAVNGQLNVHNSALQLNHISISPPHLSELRLPVLRTVAVPGTWADF